MSLYNLKSTGTILYSITKFDDELNPEATYSVARTACDCPAGHRASCRHRQMLPALIERVDTAWFYNFDTKSWEDPTGQAKLEQSEAKEGFLSNEIADGDLVDEDLTVSKAQPMLNADQNLETETSDGFLPEQAQLALTPQAEGHPTPSAFKRRV